MEGLERWLIAKCFYDSGGGKKKKQNTQKNGELCTMDG